MSGPPELSKGMTFTVNREVTAEHIRRFAELSGDTGRHHMEPDEKGRLMAHGLLTATLPTMLGGKLNFMAREMRFEFLKGVYAGDTLTCLGTVESAERKPLSWRVAFSFDIRNQAGELVVRGSSAGVILRSATALERRP